MRFLLPILALFLSLQAFVAGDLRSSEETIYPARQASTHSIRYLLSLPTGVRDPNAKRWSVLVCIAGADSNFRGLLEKYEQARGDRPILLVVPCTFSNTNAITGWLREHYRTMYPEEVIREAEARRLDWDEAGLLAILDDLKKAYDIEERICMTGFSGGGLLTYRMLFKHPNRLALAVPVCANYFDDNPVTDGPANLTVPIRLINGARDRHGRYWLDTNPPTLPALPVACALVLCLTGGLSYLAWRLKHRWAKVGIVLGGVIFMLLEVNQEIGLNSQSAAALQRLRVRGFTDLTHDVISDMAHEPAQERVLRLLKTD